MTRTGHLFALIIFVLPASLAYSADEIVGPKKAEYNETVFIDLNVELGDDPKFDVSPKPQTLRVLKDFSGKPTIILIPGKENKGKTLVFFYADNKNKKTKLYTHAIEVPGKADVDPVPPGPLPPGPPVPTPVTNKYFNELKGAYLVNPAADKLPILIDVYKEMSNTTFAKRSDAAAVLSSITGKKLQPTDLRTVRTKVHTFLDRDVGTDDAAPFDPVGFKQFFVDVSDALEAVRQSK